MNLSANVLLYQNKKHEHRIRNIVFLITHEGPFELKTRRVTIRFPCRYILLSVDIGDGLTFKGKYISKQINFRS
jgi:hypothetical protein